MPGVQRNEEAGSCYAASRRVLEAAGGSAGVVRVRESYYLRRQEFGCPLTHGAFLCLPGSGGLLPLKVFRVNLMLSSFSAHPSIHVSAERPRASLLYLSLSERAAASRGSHRETVLDAAGFKGMFWASNLVKYNPICLLGYICRI